MDDVTLGSVCNRTGLTATDMRNKFGFETSTTTPEDILTSDTIGTVFIATRHGDHAALSAAALRNGQHVFVEKPMALGDDDLATLSALLAQVRAQNGRQTFMVGFNRRFAPLVTAMRDFFASTREPSIIHYYVNAGFLPADHWTHDPVDGGGRIIGEVCHFIDTIQFLTGGALPVRLHAEHIASDNTAVTPHDNVAITMRMNDGSVGVITYVANGDSSVPKERIVMSAGLSTAIMDNFTTLDLHRGGRKTTKKSAGDKGHRNEVIAFMDAIRAHRAEVIPFDSMIATTRATFRILDSLVEKQAVTL
jgi:polar amino acid transport system substrate-binding protein